MRKKINSILKETLKNVKPPEEDLIKIKKKINEFKLKVNKEINSQKIKAKIFVGGSVAKGTLIKKDKYDVDIFIIFDREYKEKDISKLTAKILKEFKFSKVHGSRDYYVIKFSDFFFEVIPVIKVNKARETDNTTDFSYLHVKYTNKKIKSEKILEDIMISKVFCYANKCYGAESYIRGFSGYSLELLIYHYKGFLNFVKSMANSKNEKIVIDIEKHYGKKSNVFTDLNSSKLNSPIILIDPTHKQRNALACLSNETFNKFKKICRQFLKNPSEKFFEFKNLNIEKIKSNSDRNNFVHIKSDTNKQEGNIAGSKLLKFYMYLGKEIEKSFEIKKRGFEYIGGKSADYFFVAEKRKEILISGPEEKDKKNFELFRKKHKDIFIKDGRVFSRKKIEDNIITFLKDWKRKNARRMREMFITNLKLY